MQQLTASTGIVASCIEWTVSHPAASHSSSSIPDVMAKYIVNKKIKPNVNN